MYIKEYDEYITNYSLLCKLMGMEETCYKTRNELVIGEWALLFIEMGFICREAESIESLSQL